MGTCLSCLCQQCGIMSGQLNTYSIKPHDQQPAIMATNSETILDSRNLDSRNLEPWEVAFFNGGAIMDEIPVSNRDIHDQVVFRDPVSETQPENGMRRKTLDANRYATKKTIAQGMLDVALLTANASQLKYVLQLGVDKHPFYHLMLGLIIVSIVLQGIVACLSLSLNLLRDCRLDREDHRISAL